jgi:thiol-disulfide isomerase/thioredoxin
MLTVRKSLALAVLFGLVVSAGAVAAGENAKPGSRFVGKTIDLTLKDGKLSHPTEFTDDDSKFNARFHFKVFTVQLEKGKIYRIDHKGTGGDKKFDPYLILEDESGKQLDYDDDSGGGLDARIVFKAPKTAKYRIVATTFVPGQTGKFALEFSAPTKSEAVTAELRDRAAGFGALKAAQRKALAQEVRKHLEGLDGDLTFHDFRLVLQFADEAEVEGTIDLAREVLQEGVKQFSAAKSEPVSKLASPLEGTLKTYEKIGKAIEISGKTTAGKDYDLRDLKGKVVLVDFWGTWCGPCVAEIPNMVAAYEKYHKRGFDIIGVSSDKNDDVVVKFMAGRKLPWACINVEDSRKIITMHDVDAFPTPVLVDQAGRVVSLRARGPNLERMLDRLLPEKK